MALSVSFFIFFENDIFTLCHDLAHGKHFLVTFFIYFFFKKLAHDKHFLLIFFIYFFFILCRVSHICTRQTMCLPCAGASGTRQTDNNILCINLILFSIQVYLLNKSIFFCNFFVK